MKYLQNLVFRGGKSIGLLLLLFLLLGNGGVWAQNDPSITTVATFKSADLITGSGYSTTYGGDDWYISIGGNNKSLGFNNKNCKTISDALGTEANASNNGIVVKSKKQLNGVNRITFLYTGGSGDGGKIYLASSNDNVSWTAISLKEGEGLFSQGTTVSQNTELTFEFDNNGDAYYGIILDKGDANKAAYRFDNVVITFDNVSTGPSINVDNEVNCAADATSGTISYTINNPVEGKNISASFVEKDLDWIRNLDVTTPDVVKFELTENTSPEPRTAHVKLEYEGAESKTVTVTQRGVVAKHTVTFADDGSTLSESTGGEGVTLPIRDNVSTYTFIGWTVSDLVTETTTKPTIYSGVYNPTEDITLYPVYTRTDEGGLTEIPVSTTIETYATKNSWADGTKYTNITLNDDITASAVGSSNTGKYYKKGYTWRIYSSESGKLSISAKAGASLKSVTLKFTGESSNKPCTIKYGETEITTDTPVSVSGTTAEFSVTSGKGFITSISVVYTKGSSISYYTSHPIATATITLSAACNDGNETNITYYGTYSNSKPFVVPDDITVSEINVANGKLNVQKYKTGAIVPANTGVMVSSNTEGNHDVELSEAAGTSVLGNDNMLRPTGDNGIAAAKMAANDANCKYYRLTMHKGTTLGFFYGAADGAAFDVVENKAYLAVPVEMAAKVSSFVIGGGSTTAIDGIEAGNGADANRKVYNLQGQRVSGTLPKGLYIIDGRKVIVK